MNTGKGAWTVWTGRVVSGLVVAFLAMDALGKLLQLKPVMETMVSLGFKAEDVLPIGIILAIGVILFAVPRTALVGAIYLTAYLGGAFATHLRVGSPLFTHLLFAAYVGGLLWMGLFLCRPGLLRQLFNT